MSRVSRQGARTTLCNSETRRKGKGDNLEKENDNQACARARERERDMDRKLNHLCVIIGSTNNRTDFIEASVSSALGINAIGANEPLTEMERTRSVKSTVGRVSDKEFSLLTLCSRVSPVCRITEGEEKD